MKLLTIGGATYDILISYAGAEMLHRHTTLGKQSFLLLEEGKKIEIDTLQYKTGGGATNAAAAFARLGFNACALFKIGTDFQGDFILNELQQEHIDISCAQRTSELATSTSCIIACPSGDRTLLVYRGASTLLTHDDIPTKQIETSQGVYITSLSGKAMPLLPAITKTAREKNVFVAVNPGTNQLKTGTHILRDALPTIDVLILNAFEATLLMHAMIEGTTQEQPKPAAAHAHIPSLLRSPITYQNICFALTHFFKTVLAQGPSIVVVTNGAEGVYVAHKDTLLFHPSLPVEVVSTLGAGDAFGSTFVASLKEGKEVADAMRSGILNSCSVLKHYDAKTGLLKKDVLERQLTALDKTLLYQSTLL